MKVTMAAKGGKLRESDYEMFTSLRVPPELLVDVMRVTDPEAREYGITGHGDLAGILFLYRNPVTGQRTSCRLRRDNPEVENGKSKNKYLCPYGDRRHFFYAPGAAALLADPTVEILLVEAEKCALALTAFSQRTGRKLLVIAIGGCWGWRGRIGKVDGPKGERFDELGPLPDLDFLNGRKVDVLLDSNVTTNPKVQAAETALVRELRKRKADVAVFRLPAGEGVNGPDDYIWHYGDEAMAKVMETPSSTHHEIKFSTAAQLATETPAEPGWLVRLFVAASSLTILIGKVKSAGKTTLVLHMLRCLLTGSPFLGNATRKTAVVYLTEQPTASFRAALSRAELLGHTDLHILFWHEAMGHPWVEVVAVAMEKCKEVGAGLLVVDTLGQFTALSGDAENNAGDILGAIRPLQMALASGIAVLVVSHERKSGGDIEDSARGSSAFAGAADVVLSLRRPQGKYPETYRQLSAISRFGQMPASLMIELTLSGYVAHGTGADVAMREAKTAVLKVLPTSHTAALTMEQLIKTTRASRSTLRRVIPKMPEIGTIGEGTKGDPTRYYRVGGTDAFLANMDIGSGQNTISEASVQGPLDPTTSITQTPTPPGASSTELVSGQIPSLYRPESKPSRKQIEGDL